MSEGGREGGNAKNGANELLFHGQVLTGTQHPTITFHVLATQSDLSQPYFTSIPTSTGESWPCDPSHESFLLAELDIYE